MLENMFLVVCSYIVVVRACEKQHQKENFIVLEKNLAISNFCTFFWRFFKTFFSFFHRMFVIIFFMWHQHFRSYEHKCPEVIFWINIFHHTSLLNGNWPFQRRIPNIFCTSHTKYNHFASTG